MPRASQWRQSNRVLRGCRARALSRAWRARASGQGAPSNMRLKLAGGDRSKGNGVLCPGGHETFVHYSCADGRVARSLSASR